MTHAAPIPDRSIDITGVAMAAYAGATWDWFQTHLDTAAARAAGFERPVVDGQMLGAQLAAHAQDGVGRASRVVAMSFRHRAPVFRGDRIRVRGTATWQENGIVVIRHHMTVVDGDEVVREVITGAETTVVAGNATGPA